MNKIILKESGSDKFTTTTYPDGQRSIKLNFQALNIKEPVDIICRIKYFEELEILLCLVAALRKNDFIINSLNFVYLFGMRSDRAFNKGEPNYFRDVIAPIINGLQIENIGILHAHSKLSSSHVKNAISYIHADTALTQALNDKENNIIIRGDASVEESYGQFHFDKRRMGNDIHVTLHEGLSDIAKLKESTAKNILIFDDLCDGGGTFIEEAKYLRTHSIEQKLILVVTHALFTKGYNLVADHFDEIICTNSYQDIIHEKFKQIKVI